MQRLQAMEARLAARQNTGPALNELYRPPTEQYQNGGWGGGINANNFELKPSLISMVQSQQFGGKATEDPNAHLSAFLDICDTIKINGVSNDIIRLRMFGFSLRDRAKDWYKTLDRSTISTWVQMCQIFLAKYFLPSKAQKIIAEITHFSQHSDESIYEAWERYKDTLRRCPQHGFSEEQQITNFYSGLTHSTKRMVDASAGGCLVNRTAREAMRIIEEMASTSFQWPSERQATIEVEDFVFQQH